MSHQYSIQWVTKISVTRDHFTADLSGTPEPFDVVNVHFTDNKGRVFTVKAFAHATLTIEDPDAPAPADHRDPVPADPIPDHVLDLEAELMADGYTEPGESPDHLDLSASEVVVGRHPFWWRVEDPLDPIHDDMGTFVDGDSLGETVDQISLLGDTLAKQIANRQRRTYLPGLIAFHHPVSTPDEVRGWDEAGEVQS